MMAGTGHGAAGGGMGTGVERGSAQAAVLSGLAEAGATRGLRGLGTMFVSGLFGGAYIAVGAAMFAQTLALYEHRLLSAVVFPVGLLFVVSTGVDLLTSNMLYALLPIVADCKRNAGGRPRNMVRLLVASGLGNLVASFAMARLLVVGAGDMVDAATLRGIASAKLRYPPHVVFCKAVGANFLVNLAVFQASAAQAQGVAAKLVMLWLPITTFVFLGLEHVVANMFFLPAGVLAGADLGWGQVLLSNLLPCLLGNFAGATLFAFGQWHISTAGALPSSPPHHRPHDV